MLEFLKRLFGPTTAAGPTTVSVPARAEAGQQINDEQFEQLVADVRDYAIFLLDAEGNVQTWNAGAERIKGYRADEIIGKHFSVFYPQDKIDAGWPEQELAQARSNGRFEDEGWRVRMDG